jgi:hypothetical protein
MTRSLLSLATCCAITASAADGKSLIDETFSGSAIPKNWEPGGRANSFTIADSALRGVAQPDDSHGPSIGVPIEGHDLTVQFRVKFASKGYFLFLIDGDSAFGGQAHLLRFALDGNFMQLAQDRGSLESKAAQKVEKDAAAKAGTKPPVPTKEQLADLKFYRTESLARQPAKTGDEWHAVKIELRGNDVTAQVDALPAISGKGTVLDVKKSRVVFLVGNSGDVRIDDVKVNGIAP